jgi:Coenzyme PQQ synthesis protein D (PqqD)
VTREFALSTRVLRNPNAVWRTFEQETAIILPESSSIRTVNEVGARCWDLADGRTFGEIVEVLLNEFEVPRNQLEVDLRDFLAALDERHLLERPEE